MNDSCSNINLWVYIFKGTTLFQLLVIKWWLDKECAGEINSQMVL